MVGQLGKLGNKRNTLAILQTMERISVYYYKMISYDSLLASHDSLWEGDKKNNYFSGIFHEGGRGVLPRQ